MKMALCRRIGQCIMTGMSKFDHPAIQRRRRQPPSFQNPMKTPYALLVFIPAALLAILSLKGCYTVDAGVVGVKTQWGKIIGGPVEPGLTWVNPIGGDLVKYDCREQRLDLRMDTYTKDVQTATMSITVTYSIDRSKVADLHSEYGRAYAERIITPTVVGITKDVIGQWEADKLINGREQATREIHQQVSGKLASTPVRLGMIVLSNIDYSDVFEKAIEAKQVAMQRAIESQNKTRQIEEEARQKVISAKAEAESMQIRGDALKANPALVPLEAVQKWDGKAPSTLVVGGDASAMLQAR